jgi:AraC-like DNA-binding protein
MQLFLAARAASGSDPAAEVVFAWRRLVESSGRLPIGTVADEVGWSRQHLIRMFRRCFGQPPKTLARMVRLRTALSRARAEGRWQQAAADAGYFDESHFVRDLREFTGTTPGRYLRAALPCGCVRQVNSLQDRSSDRG